MVPAVSIGLPVYNGSATLAAALDSLLAQTFADFEIVISDNASSDATQDICESYAARDKRILYMRQPRNVGGTANFEWLIDHSQADLFMWAAHDDTRDPSYIAKATAALRARPDCVLAASDVLLSNSAARSFETHRLTGGIESARPAIRYRAVVTGGWTAIYGLIRRQALSKTRRFAGIAQLAAFGIAPDYRLVELCLQGPFAYLPENLIKYSVSASDVNSCANLSHYLDPEAQALSFSSFYWLFVDLWLVCRKYQLSIFDSIEVQSEFLAGARRPGTLHEYLSIRNMEAKLDALASKDNIRALKLTLERAAFIGPSRWSLLLQKRALSAQLRDCRANLIDRTTRLEQATMDLVDRTERLERALADLDRLKPTETDAEPGS